MAKLNKKMVSFSMIHVIIFLCVIAFIMMLAYAFFGRASMSAHDKLSDMNKYSSHYSESFLKRTNLLYLYVDTSNVDYYSKFMSENVITGDMNTSRNMLFAIGLENEEKEVFKQIDNAWNKYIAPAEQNALNKMIEEAKPEDARKFISSSEYVSCINYISDSQKTLSTAISNRINKDIKTYDMWQSVFQVGLIFMILVIIAVSFKCKSRISRLGAMVEKERESYIGNSATSEVLKRREMRNLRRNRR